MKVFPFGEYIIGFWLFILITIISVGIGVLTATFFDLLRAKVLWKTKVAILIRKGYRIKWPFYLKQTIYERIIILFSIISTFYSLYGPLLYFIKWLRGEV